MSDAAGDAKTRPRPPLNFDGEVGGLRSAYKRLTDRLIGLTSDVLGEDIDDKISRALPLPRNEVGADPFGASSDWPARVRPAGSKALWLMIR
jgi:hypothetical protein